MVYCIKNDTTANWILPVVYISMLIGNVAYIVLVFKPLIDEYTQQQTDRFPAGALVEFLFFELFNFMMVWSHIATMCTQPGFVPL